MQRRAENKRAGRRLPSSTQRPWEHKAKAVSCARSQVLWAGRRKAVPATRLAGRGQVTLARTQLMPAGVNCPLAPHVIWVMEDEPPPFPAVGGERRYPAWQATVTCMLTSYED